MKQNPNVSGIVYITYEIKMVSFSTLERINSVSRSGFIKAEILSRSQILVPSLGLFPSCWFVFV